MHEELIERLRQLASNTGKMTWVNDLPMPATAVLHLAADDIERLTAELATIAALTAENAQLTLDFNDLKAWAQDIAQTAEARVKVMEEALLGYMDGCTNDECEACENARQALGGEPRNTSHVLREGDHLVLHDEGIRVEGGNESHWLNANGENQHDRHE